MGEKNIIIIDDSALMRRVISDIIESDKRFRLIGTAINGLAGLIMLQENVEKVDVVLLDINMPMMNGIEVLEEIKRRNIKTTVIIVSTIATKEAKETIRALELGAFDFVTKPDSFEELRSNVFSYKLLDCLSIATKLKEEEPYKVIEKKQVERPMLKKLKQVVDRGSNRLVAIACSTGGPKALHTIIPGIPEDLNAGIVIVQHMPEGFTKSLADRLNSLSRISVKEAEDGDILMKGNAYLAKGGMHLRVKKDEEGRHILKLYKEEPRSGLLPCADVLYESLVDSDYDEITCVVLTGMGSDGSAGINMLSKNKNVYVIAQDKETSIVYGMPKMIKRTGLVNEVVSLDGVSNAIVKNVGVH